jgi:uncharacterized protein YkwD
LLVAGGLAWGEKDDDKLSKEARLILKATNAERAAKDLPALKMNPLLVKAAQKHSENMAKQEKMDHELDGEGPADRVRDAGYKFGRLGENVAFGMDAKDAVPVWMKSEGHRKNILSDQYEEIGVGVAKDADGRPYYTQVFGTPLR